MNSAKVKWRDYLYHELDVWFTVHQPTKKRRNCGVKVTNFNKVSAGPGMVGLLDTFEDPLA